MKVLVVDDSAIARQLLSTILSAAGMEVQVAADPVLALPKVHRWNPDVAFFRLRERRSDRAASLRPSVTPSAERPGRFAEGG